MKDTNYIDFTDRSAQYFTNKNEPICTKQEPHIRTSTYRFLEHIGDGVFTKIETNDFSIEIIDIQLAKTLIVKTKSEGEFLEFSHLLGGEQKIETNTKHGTIIYKAEQSFLAYITDYTATYHLSHEKRFKEIRIRISDKMSDFFDIHKRQHNIHVIENTFVKKTKKQTQQLLIDLIENNLKGHSKTIYMKSKIGEILSNYLSTDDSKTPFCAIINSIKDTKRFIMDNLDKQITSKYIAKEMHLNETELKQNFKKLTGLSIQKFSLKLKMEKAKSLLKLTEYPIYQIAEETGYKNATHFTNAFKKYYETLPKEFRASTTIQKN